MEGNLCRICLTENAIPVKTLEEAGFSETILREYVPEIGLNTKGPLSLCDRCLATVTAFRDLRKTAQGTEVKIEEYVEHAGVVKEEGVDLQDFKQKRFSCDTCKAYFCEEELYEAHLLTHLHEKRFQCRDCGKSFSTCNNLQKHCQYVHGNTSVCDTKEASTSTTDTEIFKCNVCHRRFSTEKLMKKHRTSAHTEKGKHVCKKCRSTFSSVLSKRRHCLRCMGKVGPIICPTCRKGYYSNWNFKRHFRMIHEPKPENRYEGIRCKYCGLIFEESEDYFRHLRVVHNMNYACTICFKKFAHRHNVRRHLMQLHTTEERAKNINEHVKDLKTVQINT